MRPHTLLVTKITIIFEYHYFIRFCPVIDYLSSIGTMAHNNRVVPMRRIIRRMSVQETTHIDISGRFFQYSFGRWVNIPVPNLDECVFDWEQSWFVNETFNVLYGTCVESFDSSQWVRNQSNQDCGILVTLLHFGVIRLPEKLHLFRTEHVFHRFAFHEFCVRHRTSPKTQVTNKIIIRFHLSFTSKLNNAFPQVIRSSSSSLDGINTITSQPSFNNGCSN